MKRIDGWIEKSTRSLEGKTVAVSGATGGLGRELCKILLSLGADLILLDRNKQRSFSLINELKTKYPKGRAVHITVDLEDIDAVRDAASELESKEPDYLILNAGAYSIPRHKCSTGFDNVFQINFVSPYLLARKLLPAIEKKGGRVVVVGSIAHNYSKTDPRDLDFSTRSSASKVYGNAKRYLMFSLIDNASVSLTHPGIAVTGITGHYPKLIYAVIKYPMKLIFMSPRKACLSIIAGLFEDEGGHNQWIGPSIFNVWGFPKRQRLETCKSDELLQIRRTAEDIFDKLNKKQSSDD